VDLLAEFSFRIVYRPGASAVFPDALSRRNDYLPEEDDEPDLVQALPNLDTTLNIQSTLTPMLRGITDAEDVEEEEEDIEAESPFDSMLESSVVAQGQAEDIELELIRNELDNFAHDTVCQEPITEQHRRT